MDDSTLDGGVYLFLLGSPSLPLHRCYACKNLSLGLANDMMEKLRHVFVVVAIGMATLIFWYLIGVAILHFIGVIR